MTDIATLGIKVDASQATSAAAALDKLSASGKSAATSAASLEKANLKAKQSTAEFAKQAGLARHEMINLSRQAQDTFVSLAGNQSPLMVLIQQGPQIADIFTSSKGSVRGFASQVAGAITPARALAGGIALTGVAAFAAYSQWKSYAKQVDDTARIAGTTSLEISKLQSAASGRGIGDKDFFDGIQRFSRGVYDAQNGMGGLLTTLRANGVAAKNFNGYLDGAADLIKRASSDQQRLVLLQQMGLPATMEWVRLLSGGADGLKRAKQEYTGLAQGSDAMLAKQRELEKDWNGFWTSAGEKARNAFVVTASGFVGLMREMSQAYSKTNTFDFRFDTSNPASESNALRAGLERRAAQIRGDKPVVDPSVEQARLARAAPALGLFGQTHTPSQQVNHDSDRRRLAAEKERRSCGYRRSKLHRAARRVLRNEVVSRAYMAWRCGRYRQRASNPVARSGVLRAV